VRGGGWERYPIYKEVRQELVEKEEAERARAASKRTREGNVRYKAQVGGGRKREVLLDRKSHRRESRREVRAVAVLCGLPASAPNVAFSASRLAARARLVPE
jgi:hypothetical protein